MKRTTKPKVAHTLPKRKSKWIKSTNNSGLEVNMPDHGYVEGVRTDFVHPIAMRSGDTLQVTATLNFTDEGVTSKVSEPHFAEDIFGQMLDGNHTNPLLLGDEAWQHQAITDILLNVFGPGAFDDSASDTARRVLKFWHEFSVLDGELDFNFTTFPAAKGQMVVCDHIEFSSLCAHHLLPFYGHAHVGYIPNEVQVGLSKIPRLVKQLAHKPQVQENLTQQIADEMKNRLVPQGVMVVVEARHTCMACRGVASHNAMMRTSALKGVFLTNDSARAEFFNLIRGAVL
jgi:GTP cyclohydrolase I